MAGHKRKEWLVIEATGDSRLLLPAAPRYDRIPTAPQVYAYRTAP